MFKRPLLFRSTLAIALAIAATLVFWIGNRKPASTKETALVTSQPLMRLNYEIGKVYTYKISWESDQRSSIKLTQNSASNKQNHLELSGTAHLEAQLDLEPLMAPGEAKAQFMAQIHDVKALAMDLMGKTVFAENSPEAIASLTKYPHVVELADNGSLLGEHFSRLEPEPNRQFLQSLWSELQFRLSPSSSLRSGDSWFADEELGVGTARTQYTLEPFFSGAPFVFTKRRVRYTRLPALAGSPDLRPESFVPQSSGKISLERGILQSFAATEKLDVAGAEREIILYYSNKISLSLLSIRETKGKAVPNLITEYEFRGAAESVISPEMEKQMLDQRVGDMNLEKLVGELSFMANLPKSQERNRYLWQASGLIIKYPALAAKLIGQFNDGKNGRMERALLMDVLAAAGNRESQAAMRTILSSQETKAFRTEYGLLLQRCSLLEKPLPETAEFLKNSYSEALSQGERQTYMSSAYALGSVIPGLRSQGNDALAAGYNALLVEALTGADNDEDRTAYLRALGNAAMEENGNLISTFSENANPKVREAVAAAFRQTPTQTARQTLYLLAEDSDANVQGAAISTLLQFDSAMTDIDRISGSINAGKVAPRNFGLIVQFAQKTEVPPNQRRNMLEYVLSHENQDAELKEYVRQLLESNP